MPFSFVLKTTLASQAGKEEAGELQEKRGAAFDSVNWAAGAGGTDSWRNSWNVDPRERFTRNPGNTSYPVGRLGKSLSAPLRQVSLLHLHPPAPPHSDVDEI